MRTMTTKTIHPVLLALILGVALSGCGSVMKALVGHYNVDSVTLAQQCETDSALVTVRMGRGHASKVNQAQNVLLEALYLRELGREEESRALYPQIKKLARKIKTDKQVEKELDKAAKDLGKVRKREGFDPDCQNQ